jgi:methionyl-tRNA synthetase
MERLALHDGASAAFRIVDAANEYIAETAPWTLAKDPGSADRLTSVLFDLAEAIRVAAVLLLPVMPASAAEILTRVGDRTPLASLRLDRDTKWRTDGERHIVKGPALWPRVEESTTEGAVVVSADSQPSTPMSKEKPVADTPPVMASPSTEDGRLGIDEFMKIELRTAKVLEAEAVPKSKKLIRLRVDAGSEQRTIVAGIAEGYTPEQLVGRTIVIVANLKPAKLMGIESNGMVLAASIEGGAPSLLSVDASIPPGTRVR